MSNSNNELEAELARLKKVSNEITDLVGRNIRPENQRNLESKFAELLNAGSNARSNTGSNAGSNDVSSNSADEPSNSDKSQTASTCIQNGCTNPVGEDEIICSNCYSSLGGGSKKKLTFKQKKQLKKIILLYNKIRTKLLNNK